MTKTKIERAVILAAGLGERMRPLTYTMPKPLIRVHDVPMIETIIRALHRNKIYEIYVVTGYLAEQFEYLKTAYPGVEMIYNPDYATANNIGSLYAARAYLENAFIMDGDQIIRNPGILTPEFTQSGYHVIDCERETREWLLTVKDGVIVSCNRNGGSRGTQLFSISRWTAGDGARLREHLEAEYIEKRNRSIFWDEVALFCYPEAYRLGVYPMHRDDVVEIDNTEELKRINSATMRWEDISA